MRFAVLIAHIAAVLGITMYDSRAGTFYTCGTLAGAIAAYVCVKFK